MFITTCIRSGNHPGCASFIFITNSQCCVVLCANYDMYCIVCMYVVVLLSLKQLMLLFSWEESPSYNRSLMETEDVSRCVGFLFSSRSHPT